MSDNDDLAERSHGWAVIAHDLVGELSRDTMRKVCSAVTYALGC